ncbi:MAG: tryptophan-rich sensory protein [Candidatus Peregrinibacteria bacterium]|nr:tryptophan-rich sensory protein [Candidatus Peregrinibacteria bacterium]
MKLSNPLKAAICIIGCEAAGMVGTFFTIAAISTWYVTLTKPALNPPNWIFGPVWTTLYALMGIAAFLIWKKGIEKKEVKSALGIFGLQLILNMIWTPIFFGLKNTGAAYAIIVAMWFAIICTMIKFYKINRTATYLLIPYILWVSFAAYLNLSIWLLN